MLSTILVIVPLAAIFVYLIIKGASSLNVDFFTKIPAPVGETGGGMANAIVGSVTLLGLASLIGIPVGIGGGVFLAEFGRGTKLANAVRFTADVLNGVPSIVMGLAAYALIVVPQHHFSALAGGVALGIMMIPTICRTTEEMLLMVPTFGSRSRARPGCSQLAFGGFHYRSDRFARNHHRLHAGLRARCRRNRAAHLHRAGQRLLEHQPESAHRRSSPADLDLCAISL